MRTTMIANTNKMWMNPDMVYAVAKPRAHITNRITAMVQSIYVAPYRVEQKHAEGRCGQSKSRCARGKEDRVRSNNCE